MNVSDFNYELPEELIAQDPLLKRSDSRLMVVHRDTGEIEHKIFSDVIDYLNPGDCLVINDTKVIPARLLGSKKDTGAAIEVLLLKDASDREEAAIQFEDEANRNIKGENTRVWECLVKPGKKMKPGAVVTFGDGILKGEVLEVVEDGNRLIKFTYDGIWEEILDSLGEMPLPPYITHKLLDKDRYQTVYAKNSGSAAAPTAGLHFTEELLKKIEDKGVKIARLTLHVGLGTFRPVKVETIEEHHMHSEFYMISDECAEIVNETKKNGGRIISVGTTSTRTLESAANDDGTLKPCSGWTNIFIYPGYKFKCVDSLITNFHLPESTLIMLVSAFYDREKVLEAYKIAVEEKYRFFSFGDASMFI